MEETLEVNVPHPPNSARRPKKSPRKKFKRSPRTQSARSQFELTMLRMQHSMTKSDFGRDAPKITIGMSRPKEKRTVFNPGPGTYDPPRQPISHKLAPRFPIAGQKKEKPSLTYKIDYINARMFPEVRSARIHEKIKHDFYSIIDTPAPEYIPKNEFNYSLKHKIQSRPRAKEIDLSPGPGHYDPNDDFKYCPHYHQLVQSTYNRTKWMIMESHASPADYSPDCTSILPREPSYTIGKKSRRRHKFSMTEKGGRTKRNHNQNRSTIIGVDIFHVRIGPPFDVNDALEYIRSHPEVKTVLHDVVQEILDFKPPSPVSYIRDYFLEEKERLIKEIKSQGGDPFLFMYSNNK